MRYLMLIKANAESEAGGLPSEELLNEMGRWNATLVQAGVLLAAEGLSPSAQGAKVRTSGGEQTVIDGPVAEATELVGGFWLIDVASRDEAIAWAKGCPVGDDGEIEVRRVLESDDFGAAFTPEARDAETRLRERIADQHGS